MLSVTYSDRERMFILAAAEVEKPCDLVEHRYDEA